MDTCTGQYGRCKIQFSPEKIAIAYRCLLRMLFSLVPSPCVPPGEKQSGEQITSNFLFHKSGSDQ